MTTEWFEQVSRSALADAETLEATYDIARLLIARDAPGDFVECGVYAGAQCAMMAQAIIEGMPRRPNRVVRLFDTFTGIPLSGEHDQELQGKPAGISACSLEQVKANMRRWAIPDELLIYHKGLFCDTVPKAMIDKIAFLRLDGDLYTSTRDCMPLYSKIVRGGWFCVDDFNLSGCRKAILEAVVPAPVYWRIPTK